MAVVLVFKNIGKPPGSPSFNFAEILNYILGWSWEKQNKKLHSLRQHANMENTGFING